MVECYYIFMSKMQVGKIKRILCSSVFPPDQPLSYLVVPSVSAESIEIASDEQDVEAPIQPKKEHRDRSETPVEHRSYVLYPSHIDREEQRKNVPHDRHKDSAPGSCFTKFRRPVGTNVNISARDEDHQHRYQDSLP